MEWREEDDKPRNKADDKNFCTLAVKFVRVCTLRARPSSRIWHRRSPDDLTLEIQQEQMHGSTAEFSCEIYPVV